MPDMLPSYISLQLAEKILFVGESWLLLKNNDDEHSSMDTSVDYDEQNRLVQQQLHALIATDEFNLFEFERIIERARIDLSLTLRNLFIDRFHLCNELEQIRGFFLIERGELYNLFVHRTNQLLLNTKKASQTIENDLNDVFKQCLTDLHLESILTNADKFKFRLQFLHQDTNVQVQTIAYCHSNDVHIYFHSLGEQCCTSSIIAYCRYIVRLLVMRLDKSFDSIQSEISNESIFQ
jgi:hypothetical protein